MVVKADRFGNPIDIGNTLLSSETAEVDRFGNPVCKSIEDWDLNNCEFIANGDIPSEFSLCENKKL